MTRETTQRVLASVLLWAWISLLLFASQDVGYMGSTLPIIGYVAVLLFSQFISKRAVRASLIVVLILALLKWGYYPSVPWGDVPAFISDLLRDLETAIGSLATGRVSLVSDGVRTLAFLGVITFGTKLLEECMARPLWLLVLLFVGEFALADVAYTFAVSDTAEMVLYLLVGLALLAMTNLPKMQVFSSEFSRRQAVRLLAAPIGVAAMMVLVGLAVPKPDGTWPKPLALWRDFESAASVNEAYGAHDGTLGGPFEGSHNVMLRVFASAPSYYRGEAMQTYTGTGWVNATTRVSSVRFGDTIPATWRAQVGPTEKTPERTITQRIEVVGKSYPVLFGGYQVTQVDMQGHGTTYSFNRTTDTISAGMVKPGTSYTVTSHIPIPTQSQLAAVRDGNLSYAFAPDLQLPASLPERDRRLAQQITAGKIGTYAKVEAIIGYLQSHETYQTQGIPYLEPGQDFVDQFLFVTHKGYCDHFSSALAVLARAVGIPSRWVQGFVTVPADPNYHGKMHEYVLRGTDAHSWAEIWFAGLGWIPMEATPSFVLPMQQKAPALHAQPAVKSALATHKTEHVGAPRAARGNGFSLRGLFGSAGSASASVLTLVALLIIALLWQGRRQRQRRSRDSDLVRMDLLLARFVRLFGRRRLDQTLREYVATLHNDAAQKEVLPFVQWYETWRYGGQLHGDVAHGQVLLRALTHLSRRQKAKPTIGPEGAPQAPHTASS